MSIPKEPRQLMINLMYLVLTALLALNVSAEIINAFITLDNGLIESSKMKAKSGDQLLLNLKSQADAYPSNKIYLEKGEIAKAEVAKFNAFLSELRAELIKNSGGYKKGKNGKLTNKLKNKKNKDASTRLLVKQGKGDELEHLINSTRAKLLSLVDDPESKENLKKRLPLEVDDSWKSSKSSNWASFSFNQMPVAACLPLLTKIENDARASETVLLDYLLSIAEGTDVKTTNFIPVASEVKNYIIEGESYESELFLGAYNSEVDNISISVNGRPLNVVEGRAIFKTSGGRLGENSYKVDIAVKNPLTKEIKTYSKRFTYEVGRRSVAVSADKMNVLYAGVENPISVSAAGVSTSSLKVKGINIKLSKVSNGKYIVKPTKVVKNAFIEVSGEGLPATRFPYRVKKIPNPIMQLGGKTDGTFTAAAMRVQQGPIPDMGTFEFPARCRVVSYELARIPKNDNAQIAKNKGARFSNKAKRMIQSAKIGDTYLFSDIKVKCPGDSPQSPSRKLGSMVFKIR